MKADAARVEAILSDLPVITQSNYIQEKGDVQAARNAYQGLNSMAKPYVSVEAWQKLEAAEQAIAAFETIDQIMMLSEVTQSNYAAIKPSVTAARNAYEALSTQAKGYITAEVLGKLLTAENAIAAFEANPPSGSGSGSGNGSIVLPGDNFTN